MKGQKHESSTLSVRVRLREFVIPPITDALVLGIKAPIGSEAMRRALALLHVAPFERIHLDSDDVVEDVLVRNSVLKKIPREKLMSLVLSRVKPFMTAEEVIHLDLSPELTIEEQL